MERNKWTYCIQSEYLALVLIGSDFDAVFRYLKELQSKIVLYQLPDRNGL